VAAAHGPGALLGKPEEQLGVHACLGPKSSAAKYTELPRRSRLDEGGSSLPAKLKWARHGTEPDRRDEINENRHGPRAEELASCDVDPLITRVSDPVISGCYHRLERAGLTR
jgi:hypothetical protein